MPLGKGYERQDCAMARALEVVGERWTLLVLRDCFFGVRRFGDLAAHLDVPRAVLSDRLATLVGAGVLERRGQEYLVTESAYTLWPVLRALAAWGEDDQRASGGTLRRFAHAECPGGGDGAGADGRDVADRGTDALDTDALDTGALDTDVGGRCPACGQVPGPADLVVRPLAPPDEPRRDDPVSRALRRPHRLLTPLP